MYALVENPFRSIPCTLVNNELYISSWYHVPFETTIAYMCKTRENTLWRKNLFWQNYYQHQSYLSKYCLCKMKSTDESKTLPCLLLIYWYRFLFCYLSCTLRYQPHFVRVFMQIKGKCFSNYFFSYFCSLKNQWILFFFYYIECVVSIQTNIQQSL